VAPGGAGIEIVREAEPAPELPGSPPDRQLGLF